MKSFTPTTTATKHIEEQQDHQQQLNQCRRGITMPVCQEGLEFDDDLGFCVPSECAEGQVLDEESGLSLLEEPEGAG